MFFDGGRTVDVYEFDGEIVVKTSRPSEGREHPVVCIALGNGHEPPMAQMQGRGKGTSIHVLANQQMLSLLDRINAEE